MRTTRPARAAVVALALPLLLAACGTSDGAAADAPTSTGAAAQGEPITVTDARGEEITLDAPAERVVALEWAQVEMVQTLGVDPVGVSDPTGYTSWVGTAAPLASETVDVGLRREPSVEAIADLEPDLIVGVLTSVPEGALEQLERVAPVVLMAGADASDPLGRVTEDFTTIATALGKEDVAEDVLDDLDARLADNAATLEAAGLAGTPVVLTSPYSDGANLTIRMHGPRTAVQAVAERMGLAAAWTDPGDDAYGLANIDLEGLTQLPADTRFLYWGNDDEDDVVTTALAGNAVWESLPFVQAGHVHRAAVGIWAYGGPASMMAWSDDLVAQLTAEA